jgi:hypothetical protein
MRSQLTRGVRTAYRATAGNAVPSDAKMEASRRSQLLDNMRQVLSGKAVFRDHPGMLVQNVLYSDAGNTEQNAIELSVQTPRHPESLSSTKFESKGTVNLTVQDPIQMLALHLVLPHVPKDVYLPRGWGYQAIQQVHYSFGAHSGSNTTLYQAQILHNVILACGTMEKADFIIRHGGHEVTQEQTIEVFNSAIVLLGIPNSTPSAEDSKIPLPTNLMRENIRLEIQFAPLRQFASGNGLDLWSQTVKEFVAAEIFYRKIVPSDSSATPNIHQVPDQMVQRMPYIYSDMQTFEFESVAGELNTFALTGLSDADLVAISLSVLPRSKFMCETGLEPVNHFDIAEIFDVEFLRGGISLDASPGIANVNQVMNTCIGNEGQFGYTCSARADHISGEEPFATVPVPKFIYLWNNAVARPMQKPMVTHNAPRYNGSSITLSFRCPADEPCTLYVVAHYSGLFAFTKTNTEILL